MNNIFSLIKNHKVLMALLMAGIFSIQLTSTAQSTSVRGQIAELNQRFAELEQNYNLLKLQISNLTAENNRLKQQLAQIQQSSSSTDVEAVVNAKIEAHQRSTENYVKKQFERIMMLLPKEQASTPTQVPSSGSSRNNGGSTAVSQTNSSSSQMTFSKDFPNNGEIYLVQPGDTLSKIAKKFGSKISYIQNANSLRNPDALKVGQKLFIPIDRK